MSKITAGRWYATEWSCRAKTTVLVDDLTANVLGKRVIAECETEEDARLIAVAPDLLDLLIQLTDLEGPLPGNQAWYDKAIEVIARATGKPRFALTYCSQCGANLGPGDHGASHCADHTATAVRHARIVGENL